MLNLRSVIAPKCTSSPSVVLAPLVKREDVLALGKKKLFCCCRKDSRKPMGMTIIRQVTQFK